MTDRSVRNTPASKPEVEAFAGEGQFSQGLIESGLHGVKMDVSRVNMSLCFLKQIETEERRAGSPRESERE